MTEINTQSITLCVDRDLYIRAMRAGSDIDLVMVTALEAELVRIEAEREKSMKKLRNSAFMKALVPELEPFTLPGYYAPAGYAPHRTPAGHHFLLVHNAERRTTSPITVPGVENCIELDVWRTSHYRHYAELKGYANALIAWLATCYSIVIRDNRKTRTASIFWIERLGAAIAELALRVLFFDAQNPMEVATDFELSNVHAPRVWRDEPESGPDCLFIVTRRKI
ncbi:hypothetical protein IOC47_22900 [Enterobacter cloacae]|uniref:hypothetical protein n=1 Tax=Enterobacter TaxID=547 RepID=UPI0018EABEFC|nr:MULTISPECIES: hypothetical protein [Enterobacter cloacae complex]HBM7601049.1 hypothetical protein [Enterobacter asburiae]ELS4527930.1 hypothetical protein [Enterobacter hormaechei]MBJ6502832.1 hypothetical protein [Enterobacter hormaechei]MCD1394661.1 hypothetical protein [Enterobacter cloacae]HBM7662203.1 hypothetical protein [Enterobacter asburiae]